MDSEKIVVGYRLKGKYGLPATTYYLLDVGGGMTGNPRNAYLFLTKEAAKYAANEFYITNRLVRVIRKKRPEHYEVRLLRENGEECSPISYHGTFEFPTLKAAAAVAAEDSGPWAPGKLGRLVVKVVPA